MNTLIYPIFFSELPSNIEHVQHCLGASWCTAIFYWTTRFILRQPRIISQSNHSELLFTAKSSDKPEMLGPGIASIIFFPGYPGAQFNIDGVGILSNSRLCCVVLDSHELQQMFGLRLCMVEKAATVEKNWGGTCTKFEDLTLSWRRYIGGSWKNLLQIWTHSFQ